MLFAKTLSNFLFILSKQPEHRQSVLFCEHIFEHCYLVTRVTYFTSRYVGSLRWMLCSKT